MAPERIRALALCSPALSTDAAMRAQAIARAERVAAQGMRAIVDTAMERIYPQEARGSDYAEYRSRFLAHDPKAFALLNAAFAAAAVDPALIPCPTLVLAGRHDIRPVVGVRSWAQMIARHRFAVVETAGHAMAAQAPAQVAAQLSGFFESLNDPKT
jgi:3-oxoadipate enol-lactonase